MKKISISVLAILAALTILSQATWAGESFEKVYSDENVDAYKYHKTSFFGRDLAGVTIVGKQVPQPPIFRLQHGSTTVTETTTTFSRCKERKEGRLTQAYFVGEKKEVSKTTGFQDAVNPANGQQPWRETVGGDGYSTGNLLLPAIAMGGGNAASGFGAGRARTIVSAIGQATGGGANVGPTKNINDNTNINPTKVNVDVDTTAISKSNSGSDSKAIIK